MPLYEYQCKKCAHRFEKIQKFSDRPIKKCPECGGPIEKTISAPAVQFKGSGWYVTDYPKKSHAPSSDSGSSDSGSKDSKETKSDSGSSDSGSKDSKETKKPESSSKESTPKKADKPK